MPPSLPVVRRRCAGAARLAVVTAVLATGVVVLGPAPPAAANGSEPSSTSYRSVVVEAPDRVDARVLGGDAYLAIDPEAGVEVEVSGYDGEPYLRIDGDGTVWRNLRSPATHLNEEDHGAAGDARPPPEADPDAEPAWERVADGGAYAWHDRRIQWTSTEPPPETEDASSPVPISEWTVPVRVAGRSTEISGTLRWLPADSPLGWLLAAGLVTAVGLWAARRAPQRLSAGAAVTAAGLAIVVLAAEASQHVAGRELPAAWYLGLVALGGVVAVGLAVWRGAAVEGAAMLTVLGGGVAMLLRAPALWRPVVLGPWDAAVIRGLIAVALAAAVVAVVATVLAPPRSEPAEPAEPAEPGSGHSEPGRVGGG